MVLLTVKHVIADFVLQTAWMAHGKDQKTRMGAAAPGALPDPSRGCDGADPDHRAKILVRRLIDFAIHITVDRAKGLCSSTFGMTPEHPWFWTLIGVDQALHHLTGFGLSIFMAANG